MIKLIKDIWNDPVGSKVIATGIISLILICVTFLTSIIDDKTFRQSFFSWWNIEFPVGWTMVAILLVIVLWTSISSWSGNNKKNIKEGTLKELRGMKAQLDETFEIESSNFPAKGKTIRKYYSYEILECIDDYNRIVEKLKKKWPKEYRDVITIDEKPRTPKGDSLHEADMNGTKSKVLKLIELLKG